MHELALAKAVCDTASRHAGERPVRVVRLRVGALRQVVPDSLRFYFGVVSRDTACEGAALEIEAVEARLRCRECGRDWRPQSPSFRCPRCGGAAVEVRGGGELEVESIDVEEPEEAECTAPR